MNMRDLLNQIDTLSEAGETAPNSIVPTHFHKSNVGTSLPLMMTEPGVFWWETSSNDSEGGQRGNGGRSIQRWQGNTESRSKWNPASVDGVFVNGKPVEFPEGVTWKTYKQEVSSPEKSPEKQNMKIPVNTPASNSDHTAKLNALSLQLQDKLNSKKTDAPMKHQMGAILMDPDEYDKLPKIGDEETTTAKLNPDAKCKMCGIAYKNHFNFEPEGDPNGKVTSTKFRHPASPTDEFFPGLNGTQSTKPDVDGPKTTGNITWRQIYDLNKDVIGTNPNLIKPGQTFKMPNGLPDYTVKSGDYLTKIASNANSELKEGAIAKALIESFGYTTSEGAIERGAKWGAEQAKDSANIFTIGAGAGAAANTATNGVLSNKPNSEVGIGDIKWDENFIDGVQYTPADLALDLGITAIGLVLSAGAGPAAPAAAVASVTANLPRIIRVMKVLKSWAEHAKKLKMLPKQFLDGMVIIVKKFYDAPVGALAGGAVNTARVMPKMVIGNVGFNTGMDAADDARKALKKESLAESMGSMRDRLALIEGGLTQAGKVGIDNTWDAVTNFFKKKHPDIDVKVSPRNDPPWNTPEVPPVKAEVPPVKAEVPPVKAEVPPVKADTTNKTKNQPLVKAVTIKTKDPATGKVVATYKRDTQGTWHKVEQIKDPANTSGKTAKMDSTAPVTDKDMIRRLNAAAAKLEKQAAQGAAETGKAATKEKPASSDAGNAWWEAEQKTLKELGLREKPKLTSTEIERINVGDEVVKQSVINRFGKGFWAALVAGTLIYTGLKVIDGRRVKQSDVVEPVANNTDVVPPANTDVVKPGPDVVPPANTDVVKPGPDVVKPGPDSNDRQSTKVDAEVEALIQQMQELMLGHGDDASPAWSQATSNAQSLIDQAKGSMNPAQIALDKEAARRMPTSGTIQSTKPATSSNGYQLSTNKKDPTNVSNGTVIGK